MYLPRHFKESRTDVLHELIVAHPFATLVTLTPHGLEANAIPLHLRHEGGAFGTLVGHVARANPMWGRFDPAVEALAVFQGPQAYISPSWYATKRQTGKVVPTWNYVIVQARGPLRIRDDANWIDTLLHELTTRHEAARPAPWSVDDAPREYTEALMRAVVGIEIPIVRLAGKWKVSQNQPAANRAGVVAGLGERAAPDDIAMAALVRQYGPAEPPDPD
ncbi:MAG: FMN-binding negative transcriptional regulator [Sterolibacteriaceae bacterium]|nr:FMN-binding negative transcriptional regulator [Candidatus Methylophosphatis haderslevensis]